MRHDGSKRDPKPGNILDTAQRLTSQDRNKVYGHPSLHFTCTADMVTAFLIRLGWTPPDSGKLSPEAWSQIMILDKVSRNAGNLVATGKLHIGSLEDQAGYARTGEMLDEDI